MAISRKNLSTSRSEYVKTYENIKGVDFSADCIRDDGRLPYMENLYRDYDAESDYIIESIPGYRRIFSLGEKIYAMYHQKVSEGESYVVCHAGDKIFRFSTDERDSGEALSPIGNLKRARSVGFSYGKDLFLLDGEKITVVSGEGTVGTIGVGESVQPYIPTTFINGEEHEQLNLLTDTFKEVYVPHSISEIAYGTPSLKYAITDEDRKLCEVIGIDGICPFEVHIPATVMLGDDLYTVYGIGANAFLGATRMNTLITYGTLCVIGENAFKGCTGLVRAVIAPNVKEIRDHAFEGCELLTKIYIGRNIERISENAFKGTAKLTDVYYELSESDFSLVEGAAQFKENITYFEKYDEVKIEIALRTPTRQVKSVTVDGTPYSYALSENGEGDVSVVMKVDSSADVIGRRIEIVGTISTDRYILSSHGCDARRFCPQKSEGELINKCTRAALFDGRIFLAGNPDAPNTVFFSSVGKGENGGLYFGAYDYINDGVGRHGVISLLAAQDTLFVFKSADDGDGGIFYHSFKSTGDTVRPTSYPISYAHSGVLSLGASTVFYDDPIFVSEIGICGFDKNGGTVGRDVVCRSHNVNPRLLCENLGDLRLTVWKGYLVAAVGTHIYLADSRQIFRHRTGGREYEWFFLNDIGDATESERVYRYHSIKNGDSLAHPTPDERVSDVARVVSYHNPMSEIDPIYYAIEDGVRYNVYTTGERTALGFAKTSEVLGVGELLFVGCENGAVMLFNNDKRGKAPKRLTENDEAHDSVAYERQMGRRIHSDFYDFAGIAPRYVIKTGQDSCDIPYLSKNVTRGSVSVKAKCWGHSKIKCDIETDSSAIADKCGFAAYSFAFGDMHFDSLSFNTNDNVTAVSRSAPKGWTEMQFCIYSDTYRAPIGIYSISYRFKINGRIK